MIFKNSKEWMGVILCGGKSNPSGLDRGMIKYKEKELVLHTYALLNSVFPNTILSVNEKQFPLYKKKFQDTELIVDSNQIRGPLSGILSVYSAYRVFNFFVLACDMVHLNPSLFKDLKSIYSKSPEYDFYVYQKNDSIEPFCGIYTSRGLEKIYNQYNQGLLKGFSIKEAILLNNTHIIPVKKELLSCFAVYEEKAMIA